MNIEIVPLIIFIFVTTFTPGPNNISSASLGILYGYRKTFSYMAGISSGFFVVMIICAYLSSALAAVIPVAEKYLRLVGTAYIIWLAIGILRSNSSISESEEKPSKAFSKGFLLQFFNPKVTLYGLMLYSTFLAPISGKSGCLALSAVVFALVCFASISLWTLCGATIKNKFKNDSFRKMINTLLALLLIYTAIELSGILTCF